MCTIYLIVNATLFHLRFFTEIVTQLQNLQVIRPYLEIDECDDELIDLMKKCWTDDPLERPDFGQIKQTIRRLNKLVLQPIIFIYYQSSFKVLFV